MPAFFIFSGQLMRYWLMKSEPDEFGIDDLVRDKVTPWFGVRNFQARNFMRNDMKVGDLAFFYHSSCPEPGIAGIARVSKAAYPDASQFDKKSPYYDPAVKPDDPRWYNVDVRIVRKTPLVGLAELRRHPELAGLVTLRRGNRLSITPVEPGEWEFITTRLMPARSSGRGS
jgi:predicted RNA-binding protein with PUA-like domain